MTTLGYCRAGRRNDKTRKANPVRMRRGRETDRQRANGGGPPSKKGGGEKRRRPGEGEKARPFAFISTLERPDRKRARRMAQTPVSCKRRARFRFNKDRQKRKAPVLSASRGARLLLQNGRLARLARFERAAFRLGDEKTVRLRCPSLCRKCLILLGF